MSLLPFTSQLIADVGISLGDEGKGRLIPEVADELRGTSAPVSVVLKVNGGANSGHTAGGIKLNLLPAGVVVRDAAHLCIGSGVVDRLNEERMPVRGINVAESASAKPRFARLRDELWWNAREWFMTRGVWIPDDSD